MALDFFAGCLGGLAGIVVGHPFDTVKVRLQTQTTLHYTGVTNCFIKIVSREGVKLLLFTNIDVVFSSLDFILTMLLGLSEPQGLFKGMASPLASVGFLNAIIFGVQGEAVRRFKLTGLKGEFIAGALSGAVQSLVACPMELAKTRVQVQGIDTKYSHIFFHSLKERHDLKYLGSFDCIRKIYKAEGMNGCYRGMGITLLRDTPAISLYFGSFYFLCDWLTPEGSSIQTLSPMRLLMAGGLGGTISWVLTYPIDVIKSRYQADGVGPKPNYTGIIDCVKQTYTAEGLSGFSRGILATVLRSFPLNATTLTVVTITLRFTRGLNEPQLEVA